MSHQTGSRNPFGQPAPPPVPPLPSAPTLQQLASGSGFASFSSSFTPSGTQPASQSQPSTNGNVQSHQTGGGGLISSIASSFATGTQPSTNGTTGPNNAVASPASLNGWSSSLSPQQTSSTAWSNFSSGAFSSSNPSSAPTSPPSSVVPLQSQPTGFAGSSVRPFKPSSSFGAALFEKLPPIPSDSELSTPQPQVNAGIQSSNTLQPIGTLNTQSTGFNFGPSFGNTAGSGGSGLVGGPRLQPTGTANPFRLSMAAGSALGGPSFTSSPPPNFSGVGGAPQSQQQAATGSDTFSSSFGPGAFGQTGVQGQNFQPHGQQSQQNVQSLI